jgi:hypothetical protein
VQTVKRWWFEADAWRDPQAQREFLARIDTYRDEGLPPAERRMSREDIRASSASDACTGGSWMARLDRSSPTCARAARGSLAAFMDAVVVADPVQYQRRRDERDDVSVAALTAFRAGRRGPGHVPGVPA